MTDSLGKFQQEAEIIRDLLAPLGTLGLGGRGVKVLPSTQLNSRLYRPAG